MIQVTVSPHTESHEKLYTVTQKRPWVNKSKVYVFKSQFILKIYSFSKDLHGILANPVKNILITRT